MPTDTAPEGTSTACLAALARWLPAAERDWYWVDRPAAIGCYGSGYDGWGVQSNQKYCGAMAVLGALGEACGAIDGDGAELARQRARAALRFSCLSHHSGGGRCLDGRSWGRTWISPLGIERMMAGVLLLDPWLDDAERDALRTVLCDEARWHEQQHQRGGCVGIPTGLWNSDGGNAPESNIWTGALLYRAAIMYPDEPEADRWRERAYDFLCNGISVSADAADRRVVDGKPLAERHRGANFFPHFALDHHGYLNVGYQVICLSNIAMLHFDLAALDRPAPDSLHLHSDDLLRVLRRCIFDDGRLARIGGDTRLRYCYCQDYLPIACAYGGDRGVLGDAGALVAGQLAFTRQEQDAAGDSSFLGHRLGAWGRRHPYYYTRLESDRAIGLAQLVAALHRRPDCLRERAGSAPTAGAWCEHEHGAVLHRCSRRLASFAWRAQGGPQGLCLPASDGSLAEWQHQLAGIVRIHGSQEQTRGAQSPHRRIEAQRCRPIAGGFVSVGRITEGLDLNIPEGWRGELPVAHRIAVAALPDARTMLGLAVADNLSGARIYVDEAAGLHCNIGNDVHNAHQRHLQSAAGDHLLCTPAADAQLALGDWATIDEAIGLIGVYGADGLTLERREERRGGAFPSLFVERIAYPLWTDCRSFDPDETVLDIGWAVLAQSGADETRAAATSAERLPLPGALRGLAIDGADGRRYALVANCGVSALGIAELLDAGWQRIDGDGQELDGDDACLLRHSDR